MNPLTKQEFFQNSRMINPQKKFSNKSKQIKKTITYNLPNVITMEIFTYFNLFKLYGISRVSKKWNHLVDQSIDRNPLIFNGSWQDLTRKFYNVFHKKKFHIEVTRKDGTTKAFERMDFESFVSPTVALYLCEPDDSKYLTKFFYDWSGYLNDERRNIYSVSDGVSWIITNFKIFDKKKQPVRIIRGAISPHLKPVLGEIVISYLGYNKTWTNDQNVHLVA